MQTAQWFEAAMLVCFGLAWPLANMRMLRTHRPEGKGLPFTLVILAGYFCGASAKLIIAAQGAPLAPVFWLYLLNTASVALNLFLQWHYGARAAARTARVEAGRTNATRGAPAA